MRRRLPLLVALAGLSAGCFGGAANPSDFPHYLPPGDVIPTHAKPAGRGYFADFDRHADRVEVTPTRATRPVGATQLFVATVADARGQPRRKRRVEWIIDGPGNLLEVDEAGVTPGRGYLVDNKRGVSYTGHFDHTLTRADSPAGEVCVTAGQTWCVVSGTVPGETTVTAYAPEVHAADRQTATARVTWSDALPAGKRDLPPVRDGTDPAPVPPPVAAVSRAKADPGDPTLDVLAPKSAPAGREFTVSVELANPGREATKPATVTATVPAGVEVVRADPPAAGAGPPRTWPVGAVPAGGKRVVTLVLRSPRNGPVTVTARADTADGLRADQSAAVQIGTPALTVTVATPPPAAPGDRVRLTVTVENPAATPATNVAAWVTLPPGAAHPTGANPAEVPVGTVPAGGSKVVTVPIDVTRPGDLAVTVNAVGDAGATARGTARIVVRAADPAEPPAARRAPEPVGEPALDLAWADVPTTLTRAAPATARLTLANRGTGPAADVEVVVGGDGLTPEAGTGPDRRPGSAAGGRLVFALARPLAAGATATFTIDLRGSAAGPGRVRAAATAAGQAVPVRDEQNVRIEAE